ncbi:hypothetical protein Ancab_021125, partial [Ancistrocladus abbreviatus]
AVEILRSLPAEGNSQYTELLTPGTLMDAGISKPRERRGRAKKAKAVKQKAAGAGEATEGSGARKGRNDPFPQPRQLGRAPDKKKRP